MSKTGYSKAHTDVEQPALLTERLLLRSFHLEDASEVRALVENYNVSKTTLNIPYPYQSGMAETWINTHQDDWKAKTAAVYAITIQITGQLVGAISLVNIDGSRGELGYWIGEPYWGNGYCTEASSRLIPFSFNELGLGRIVAEHLATNPASGQVMIKAGMHHVETVLKHDRNQKDASIEVYEIQNS